MTKQIKTIEPDYRFTKFEDWRNFIIRQSFEAKNKVDLIRAKEIFYPRLKITA